MCIRDRSPALQPCTSSGSEMIRATVWRGLREECGSWKTIWMLLRSGRMAPWDSRLMSLPSKVTRPEVGSSSRTSIRPVVDFPQPDSPTRPSVCPAARSKETPSTARTGAPRRPVTDRLPGKVIVRSCTDSSAVAVSVIGPPPRRCGPGSRRSGRPPSAPARPRTPPAPAVRRCSARPPWGSAGRRRSRGPVRAGTAGSRG